MDGEKQGSDDSRPKDSKKTKSSDAKKKSPPPAAKRPSLKVSIPLSRITNKEILKKIHKTPPGMHRLPFTPPQRQAYKVHPYNQRNSKSPPREEKAQQTEPTLMVQDNEMRLISYITGEKISPFTAMTIIKDHIQREKDATAVVPALTAVENINEDNNQDPMCTIEKMFQEYSEYNKRQLLSLGYFPEFSVKALDAPAVDSETTHAPLPPPESAEKQYTFQQPNITECNHKDEIARCVKREVFKALKDLVKAGSHVDFEKLATLSSPPREPAAQPKEQLFLRPPPPPSVSKKPRVSKSTPTATVTQPKSWPSSPSIQGMTNVPAMSFNPYEDVVSGKNTTPMPAQAESNNAFPPVPPHDPATYRGPDPGPQFNNNGQSEFLQHLEFGYRRFQEMQRMHEYRRRRGGMSNRGFQMPPQQPPQQMTPQQQPSQQMMPQPPPPQQMMSQPPPPQQMMTQPPPPQQMMTQGCGSYPNTHWSNMQPTAPRHPTSPEGIHANKCNCQKHGLTECHHKH